MRKVLFRADGHAKIGLGHVFRSLALAEMLSDAFECHFLIRNPLPILRKQILSICKSIIELPENTNDLEEAAHITQKYLSGNEIVVLDGYHFITDYQQIIKNKGGKIVCIDDIHAYHFVADIVINHAGGLTREKYSAEKYTQFCLGLQYALLRKPFREAARNRIYPDRRENKVFICLGGADPNNDTLEVLEKLEQHANINHCYLVLGGAYLHRAALEDFLKKSSLKIELLSNLSAEEMVRYMKKCSKAITPPSTVSYEYLSVGGELYLKIIADNQLNINNYFIKEGLAFTFEQFGNINAASVHLALQKQQKLLDGNVEERFLNQFKFLQR